jgi:N-sulfoglucosamine sulfohydrolase
MGSPGAVTDTFTPASDEMENNMSIAFVDMDSSPTKAWLIEHRFEPKWRFYFDLAFGKRPSEELYDVRNDPYMMNNLACKSKMTPVKKMLADQLMKELTRARDPRAVENPPQFELTPFTDAVKENRERADKAVSTSLPEIMKC